MEHQSNITTVSVRTGIKEDYKLKLLLNYADAINTENKNFNLTGHKLLSEIIENLIIGSLEPVKNIDVPRGTLFADIGTGAGIPGIPLSIKYETCKGILFDSNQKKIRFINKTLLDLGITNISGINTRVEDACRSEDYREKFDLVFTRAMSDIYTIAELGSPLLKVGGCIFLYANKDQVTIDNYLLKHLEEVGLSANNMDCSKLFTGADNINGIILVKIQHTSDKFPRRMPVIKRMALK